MNEGKGRKGKREERKIIFVDCLVGGRYCTGDFTRALYNSENSPVRNTILISNLKMRKTASQKP